MVQILRLLVYCMAQAVVEQAGHMRTDKTNNQRHIRFRV